MLSAQGYANRWKANTTTRTSWQQAVTLRAKTAYGLWLLSHVNADVAILSQRDIGTHSEYFLVDDVVLLAIFLGSPIELLLGPSRLNAFPLSSASSMKDPHGAVSET